MFHLTTTTGYDEGGVLMKFTRYNSITSINKTVYTDQPLPGGLWLVTEKVHGSNLSFLITRDEIKVCSRNQVLDDNSQFVGILKRMPDDIFPKLRELFDGMALAASEQNSISTLEQVTVYGELAGGYYNKQSEGTRIQKGVQYAPFNFFIGFDIKVFFSGESEDVSYTRLKSGYIDKTDAFRYFNIVGIRHVPILYCGERNGAMKFNSEDESVIPSIFNLPQIDNNIMEGVVISPDKTDYFPDGERIIFKKVNEAFHEKKSHREKAFKETKEMSEEFKVAANEILDLITENRLENILSHYSDLTEKDFPVILKEMNKDVQQDWALTTSHHIISTLEKEEMKALSKLVNTHCAKLIRDVWLPTVTA